MSEHPVTPPPLRTSPLDAEHRAAGARLAAFGGWSMPLEFAGGGTLAEHEAVRSAVGVFDVSHLGTLVVRGPGTLAHLDTVLSNTIAVLPPGRAQYTLCLAEDGGIVDDLVAYVMADGSAAGGGAEEAVLVPNAANAAAVAGAVATGAAAGVEVLDRHEQTAVLAVQGPRADAVLEAVGLPHGHAYLSHVTHAADRQGPRAPQAGGSGVVVCRTGYTGERGYELLVTASAATGLWRELVTAAETQGGRPAGLAARDTLRTEMGYPLHGSDIGPDVTPVQARLGFAVGWDKPAFAGRDAVVAERARGPARRATGLRALARGVPRPGMAVHAVTADGELGERLGVTTSGTFSPTLRVGIALALLGTGPSAPGPGDEVAVDVRGRPLRCEVVRPPFVTSHVRD